MQREVITSIIEAIRKILNDMSKIGNYVASHGAAEADVHETKIYINLFRLRFIQELLFLVILLV